MKLGVIFPQTEIGTDPIAVRDYAQAVEGIGFDYLQTFDHVIGANVNRSDRAGRRWPYTHESLFHESFVLLGYLAGLTQRIMLIPGIIVLPQRQTVLVAKQAAEVDVLSNGRLILGLGIGWNAVEYEALNEDFHNRGARLEEQITVLRALWTENPTTFEGRWHHIQDAGLHPLPVQRPIPLWIGGSDDRALRRIARLGDGYLIARATPELDQLVEKFRAAAREAGRDPSTLDLAGTIAYRDGGPEGLGAEIERWKSVGATHVAVNTMGAGLPSLAAHLEAVRQFKEAAAS